MSPPIFVLVLIVVLLLLAAAVLVPIFLVVIPRLRHSPSLGKCPSSHACQNGGTNVFANDVCSCICVGGFTGSICSSVRDSDCTTASLSDGSQTYENATIGSSVLPLLKNTQKTFDIPLNTTKILSTFAYNNLSCASENSLIDFDSSTSEKMKRLVIIPGMMSTELYIPALNLPPSELKEHREFEVLDELESNAEWVHLQPTHVLQPRQDGTQSANGIVFATSPASSIAPTMTTTAASASGTNVATTTSSTSIPSQSSTVKATDDQLNFAAAVVMYVLQSNPQINVAVAANQAIASYFQSNNRSNATVEVVGGNQRIDADFDKFQIIFGNGTVIGGSG